MNKKVLLALAVSMTMAWPVALMAETIRASQNFISTQTPTLEAFHALAVTDDIDVKFRQAQVLSVSIYGPDNLVPRVEVKVVAGVMSVRYNRLTRVRGNNDLVVRVEGPTLDKVTVQNGGDVEMEGLFSGDKLALSAFGRGEISSDNAKVNSLTVYADGEADVDVEGIEASTVSITTVDRGDVDVAGRASMATLENKGSGELDAKKLQATTVKATLIGSGDLKCWAAQELRANVQGGGLIQYSGAPGVLEKTGKAKKVVPYMDSYDD